MTKNYLFRREGRVNLKKLDRAMLLAHWGVPLLVVAFVLVYWVMGVLNYTNPNIGAMMQTEEEEKDEDTSVWMILGFLGFGSCLLMICGRFLSPRVIMKVQNMRGKNVVQSIQ